MDDLVTSIRVLLAAATPGPWKTMFPGSMTVTEEDGRRAIAHADGTRALCVENAALMAAAPELLEQTVNELEAARAEIVRLREAAKVVAGCAWLPCDQMIQCPCCNAVWWDTDLDFGDDWHGEGCKLQAALVVLGLATTKREVPT